MGDNSSFFDSLLIITKGGMAEADIESIDEENEAILELELVREDRRHEAKTKEIKQKLKLAKENQSIFLYLTFVEL